MLLMLMLVLVVCDAYRPVVDGSVRGVQRRPIEQVQAGIFSNIPLLIGTVRDEGSFFVPVAPFLAGVLFPLSRAGLVKLIAHFWPEKIATEVEMLYPKRFGESANEVGNRIVTDGHFACSVRALLREIGKQDQRNSARAAAGGGGGGGGGSGGSGGGDDRSIRSNGSWTTSNRSHRHGRSSSSSSSANATDGGARFAADPPFRGLYQFKFLSQNPLTPLFGAFHTAELAYIFHDKKEWWGEDDELLSLQLGCLATAFARSGTPNDRENDHFPGCSKVLSGVEWPGYTAKGDASLVLDRPISVETGLKREVCDRWDSIGYSNTIQ